MDADDLLESLCQASANDEILKYETRWLRAGTDGVETGTDAHGVIEGLAPRSCYGARHCPFPFAGVV
jgi:hypothetical protein